MDTKKLEDAMKEKGISKVKICQELGISRSAFYRKCQGITEFTQSEIQKIVKILSLETPVGIFFAEEVS